jgi:hypothetical protein
MVSGRFVCVLGPTAGIALAGLRDGAKITGGTSDRHSVNRVPQTLQGEMVSETARD